MVEYIKRQEAIDAVEHITSSMSVCVNSDEQHGMKRMQRQAVIELANMPSAQPERIIYANMSDEEFEKWLYEHGICNPYIHDSIPCSAVPLLIDNAISELPSAQPDIITCKDCKYHDENWRRVSVRWLPCMDMRTGSNWFCGSAERRTDDEG